MKKRTHLDRTGSVCVGFPLDGDSGDGLSSNRGSCSSGGGGTAAALTVYKIIKTNNKLPRDQTLFITPVWTENIKLSPFSAAGRKRTKALSPCCKTGYHFLPKTESDGYLKFSSKIYPKLRKSTSISSKNATKIGEVRVRLSICFNIFGYK